VRKAALALLLMMICAACAAERDRSSGVEPDSHDVEGAGSRRPSMPPVMGSAGAASAGPAGDMRAAGAEVPAFEPSGRWTSSGFEDPFEARLVAHADGTISGRVCSADLNGDPTVMSDNCGPLAAAWKADNLIHFDFEIPWTGLQPNSVRYQFVGAPGASPDVFTGVLMISGETFPITFTRCPADRAWC
jgi:hypothetical protein